MKLSERAMLVNLSISVWHAEREDSKRAAEIAARYGSDARMGKYRRYLVDPDALKPILKKRGEMRNRHYELTLPWGDDSARIITSAGFMKYRDEMQAYQRELEPMFEDFVTNYPSLVSSAATLLNGLYDAAEYPSPNQIRGYFRAGIKFRPVPESEDFRVNLGDAEVSVIRQQIAADTKSAMDQAMSDTVTRIRDVVGHLADRMKAYAITDKGVSNPFRDSLIGNVRDLVDILPGLNLTGDARITGIIGSMRSELTRFDADELRCDDTARKVVAESADDILRKLEEYGL